MQKRSLRLVLLVLVSLLFISSFSFASGAQTFGSRTLKYGMSGDDVVALQSFLMERSYSIGSATGYFGTKTLEAVKQFQRNNALVPDGIVGPKTFAVISKRRGSR